jgi:hypothetical protein
MNTTPCIRCGHPHIAVDSKVCSDCWVELGQMGFWDDDNDTVQVIVLDDDEYLPEIDTVFDREEEARGYQ